MNDNHRESVNSQNLDDSVRSSNFSINRTSRVLNQNKKITVETRVINKLINFLNLLIKELNLDFDAHKEIKNIFEKVLAEEITYKAHEIHNVHENLIDDHTHEMLDKYCSENTSLKNEIENLKKENLEMSKIIEIKNKDLEDLRIHMKYLIEKYKNEIDSLKQIELDRKDLNDLKINAVTQYKNSQEISIADDKPNNIFTDKFFSPILDYLEPRDYFYFCNSSKMFHEIAYTNKKLIEILKAVIELKNYEISSLKSLDFHKEYDVNDIELEKLFKEYLYINKTPGKELKSVLNKSHIYIKNEVKQSLGLTTTPVENKKKSSIIGSLNNVLNKFVSKRKTSHITEQEEEELEFELPEEIRNLLVEYFSSLKTNPQHISNFIVQLINEYSEYVFFSHKTLIEIREIEIVKNAVHERFKKYHKISIELENELEDLKKFAKTNKEIKDILLRQKQEVEVKYTDSITQISYLREELNKTSNKLMATTEKYNKIEQEYEAFKSRLVKEYKLLKTDYDSVSSDRNILKDALLEFKKYFMKFHLTEDGDIAYVEDESI